MANKDKVWESAFDTKNEFTDEDSIEKWIELEESGQPYWKSGNIAKKVRALIDENRRLKEISDIVKDIPLEGTTPGVWIFGTCEQAGWTNVCGHLDGKMILEARVDRRGFKESENNMHAVTRAINDIRTAQKKLNEWNNERNGK